MMLVSRHSRKQMKKTVWGVSWLVGVGSLIFELEGLFTWHCEYVWCHCERSFRAFEQLVLWLLSE